MAKLTTAGRKKLKGSQFAIPSKRKFPVNDRAHAANAKARASMLERQGKISESTETKIDTRANKVLGNAKEKEMAAKKKEAPKGKKHHHKMAKHHLKMAMHHTNLAGGEDTPTNMGKAPAGSASKMPVKKGGGKAELEKPPTSKKARGAGPGWGSATREGF